MLGFYPKSALVCCGGFQMQVVVVIAAAGVGAGRVVYVQGRWCVPPGSSLILAWTSLWSALSSLRLLRSPLLFSFVLFSPLLWPSLRLRRALGQARRTATLAVGPGESICNCRAKSVAQRWQDLARSRVFLRIFCGHARARCRPCRCYCHGGEKLAVR